MAAPGVLVAAGVAKTKRFGWKKEKENENERESPEPLRLAHVVGRAQRMSVYQTIFLIDESAFDAWINRSNTEGVDSCVAQLLTQARAHAQEEVRQRLDEHLDDEGKFQVGDISDLLMLTLHKMQWPLGNMLGQDAQRLEAALALVPSLAPVVDAFDKPQRDLGKLRKIASGLHVVSDTAVAANLEHVVSQWTSREQVAARLATLQLPWTARLFGRRKHLLDWTASDSMWERWLSIAEALKANASTPGTLLVCQTEC